MSAPRHLLAPLLRRLAQDRRGAVAIEFAFVAPMLVLLVAGVMEGALLMSTRGAMEHVGRQAARGVALGSMTETEAQAFIETKLREAPLSPEVQASVDVVPGEPQVVRVEISLPFATVSENLPLGVFRMVDLRSDITLRDEQ